MSVQQITRVLISLLLVLLYADLAFSAAYHVDGTTGDDANDGTTSAPWKTIGHALTIAIDTDTIYIHDATYRESLELKSAEMSLLNIKGVSRNGHMPIIDADGEFRAFDLKDFNGIIQGLEIKGAAIHGINIAGESKNARILRCTVHDNRKGIHVADTSTPFISGNVIYSNSQCGIGIMGESSPTIDGNHIYQNGNGIPSGPSAGICIPGDSTPAIYNNIIRNNYNSGINILDHAAPVIINNTFAHHHGGQNSPGTAIKIVQVPYKDFVKISNNIFTDNDISLFSTARKPVTGNDYNEFWQNDTDFFGFTAGSHAIFTNPFLAVDYSLGSNSPCIDSGTSAGAPSADINGVARPLGNGFDMGACEYPKKQEDNSGTPDQQCILSVLSLLLQ